MKQAQPDNEDSVAVLWLHDVFVSLATRVSPSYFLGVLGETSSNFLQLDLAAHDARMKLRDGSDLKVRRILPLCRRQETRDLAQLVMIEVEDLPSQRPRVLPIQVLAQPAAKCTSVGYVDHAQKFVDLTGEVQLSVRDGDSHAADGLLISIDNIEKRHPGMSLQGSPVIVDGYTAGIVTTSYPTDRLPLASASDIVNASGYEEVIYIDLERAGMQHRSSRSASSSSEENTDTERPQGKQHTSNSEYDDELDDWMKRLVGVLQDEEGKRVGCATLLSKHSAVGVSTIAQGGGDAVGLVTGAGWQTRLVPHRQYVAPELKLFDCTIAVGDFPDGDILATWPPFEDRNSSALECSGIWRMDTDAAFRGYTAKASLDPLTAQGTFRVTAHADPQLLSHVSALGLPVFRLRGILGVIVKEERPGVYLAVNADTLRRVSQVPEDVPLSWTAPTGQQNARPAPDIVNTDVDDMLHFKEDVEAFARVILDREASLPLAIGLFGDWGSGKTSFMTLMRRRVEQLAKVSASSSERTPYCTGVAQITFNAWHYVDTNLWASLMSHILQQLFVQAGISEADKAAERERLLGKLKSTQQMLAEAERDAGEVAQRITNAEAQLKTAEEEQSSLVGQLQNLRHVDVYALLDGPQRQVLKDVASRLNLGDAKVAAENIEQTTEEFESVFRRMRVWVDWTLGLPRIWQAVVVVVLILVPALVTGIAAHRFELEAAGKLIAAASAAIVESVGALAVGLNLLKKPLARLAELRKQIDQARRMAAEANEKASQPIKAALNDARLKQESIKLRVAAALAEKEKLERRIAHIRDGRGFREYLDERCRSEDYRKHLGIVSLIRQDFEELSKLLKQADMPVGLKRTERVVLYIDDLDRCPAHRVVEVLQAVHLFLAFDVFAVVVGVDQRWLEHSLADVYAVNAMKTRGVSGWFTPQNYLEKIFQIPFCVRPGNRMEFSSLVEKLMQDPSTSPGRPSAGRDARHTSTETERHALPENEVAAKSEASEQRSVSSPSDHELNGADSGLLSELDAEAVRFAPWERAFMSGLHWANTTPRIIKRMVNVYRLIRAGLPRPQMQALVGGTEGESGQYQAVMLLLAIQSAYSDIAEEVMRSMLVPIAGNEPIASEWDEWTGQLHSLVDKRGASPIGARWRDLESGVHETRLELTDMNVFRRWIPCVARFSFDAQAYKRLCALAGEYERAAFDRNKERKHDHE